MIKFIYFILLFLIYSVQIAFANSNEYATAILQANIDYHQRLAEYFADEKVPDSEKNQVFFDLSGRNAETEFQEFSQHLYTAANQFRELLKYPQGTFFNNSALDPLKQKQKSILELFPESQNFVTEEENRKHFLRSFYVIAFTFFTQQKQNNKQSRLPKHILKQQIKSKFRHLNLYKDLMEVLEPEISDEWMKYYIESIETSGSEISWAAFDNINFDLEKLTHEINSERDLLSVIYADRPTDAAKILSIIDILPEYWNQINEFTDIYKEKNDKLVILREYPTLKLRADSTINQLAMYLITQLQLRLYPILLGYAETLESAQEEIFDYKNRLKEKGQISGQPQKASKSKKSTRKKKSNQIPSKRNLFPTSKSSTLRNLEDSTILETSPSKTKEIEVPESQSTQAEARKELKAEARRQAQALAQAQAQKAAAKKETQAQKAAAKLEVRRQALALAQAEAEAQVKPVQVRGKWAKRRGQHQKPSKSRKQSRIFSSRSNREEYLAQIKRELPTRFQELISDMYDNRMNHMRLKYDDLVTLINHLLGEVSPGKGNHVHIEIPFGISKGFKPHGKSHSSEAPEVCVRGFRAALEMAGITPELFQ